MAKATRMRNDHRGRFQTQGAGLEESESWSQNTALTIIKGRGLLAGLKAKLSPAELRKREAYFNQWGTRIEELHQGGGYDADAGGHYIKTIPHGASSDEPRVDLEIRKGKAFV